ncbi:MAG: hypothetical protein ABSB61_10815 [Anaerolineales bacterium]|jgi:predicted nucleic acid-binding Zn ribbon protein
MPQQKTKRESHEARRRRTQNIIMAVIGLLVILSFVLFSLRP